MTDQHDDFDRRLAERLGATESRIPGRGAPDLEPLSGGSRLRWAVLGTVAVGALVVGVFLSQVLPDPQVADSSPDQTPIGSQSGSVEPTPTALPSTPAPSPTATPEATDTGVPTIAWEPTTPPAAEINDLEWFSGRFVAVGSEDGRAAAWTLIPGGSWRAAEPIDPEYVPLDPDTDEPGQRFWISTVVELDGELIAMGWQGIGCCDNGRAAVWSSPDGLSWTYHEPGQTPFDTTYHFPVDATVSSDGEIVLVSAVGLGGASTVWTSSDGRTWDEQPTDLGEFTLMQLVAAGDGRLLALGDAPGETGRAARAWASADGREWTGVGLPIGADRLTAVTYDPASDVFVVGGDGPAGLQAWFTVDGSSWSAAQPLTGDSGTIAGISARNGMAIAVGITEEPGGMRVTAWRISLGDAVAAQAAHLVEGMPTAYAFRVAAGDGAHMVAGSVVEVEGGDPAGRAFHGVAAIP